MAKFILLNNNGQVHFRLPGWGADGEGGDGEAELEVKVPEVRGGPVETGVLEAGAKGEGADYGIGHYNVKEKGTGRVLTGDAEAPVACVVP